MASSDTLEELWYNAPSSLDDVSSSEDSLFLEIGNTLKDAAKETISTGIATLRTKLADAFVRSGTGKQVAQEYKYKTIGEYFPYIVLAIFAVFLGGYFLKGR